MTEEERAYFDAQMREIIEKLDRLLRVLRRSGG